MDILSSFMRTGRKRSLSRFYLRNGRTSATTFLFKQEALYNTGRPAQRISWHFTLHSFSGVQPSNGPSMKKTGEALSMTSAKRPAIPNIYGEWRRTSELSEISLSQRMGYGTASPLGLIKLYNPNPLAIVS